MGGRAHCLIPTPAWSSGSGGRPSLVNKAISLVREASWHCTDALLGAGLGTHLGGSRKVQAGGDEMLN